MVLSLTLAHVDRLVQLVCVYGYSLTVFVIASLLCVLPFEFLRWIFVIAAFVVSGGVSQQGEGQRSGCPGSECFTLLNQRGCFASFFKLLVGFSDTSFGISTNQLTDILYACHPALSYANFVLQS